MWLKLFLFSPPQGSDAWHGDVSAALVSWQWWPGAARPLPLSVTLHLVSQKFFDSVFIFSHQCFLFLDSTVSAFHPPPQASGSVRGSVWPPVRLRTVMFCHTGGPWPRLPGHPGQLPYLWERHHVVEHERQHPVHTAQGSCAVRHLHTARWASHFCLRFLSEQDRRFLMVAVRLFCGLNTVSIDRTYWSWLSSLLPP